MKDSGKDFDAIDGVAAAAGPGLIGGVIVGLTTAKAIALVRSTTAAAVSSHVVSIPSTSMTNS